MQEVGFNLYNTMLDSAIKSLKAGQEPDLQHPLGIATEIKLHVPALLPETYCNDIHERLVLYKRMANCEEDSQLDDMQRELIDRFGLLPEPARALLDSHRLRIAAKPLGILRIDASSESILIQFVPNPPIAADRIIALIQSSREYNLSGPDKLKIQTKLPNVTERVKQIRKVMDQLT